MLLLLLTFKCSWCQVVKLSSSLTRLIKQGHSMQRKSDSVTFHISQRMSPDSFAIFSYSPSTFNQMFFLLVRAVKIGSFKLSGLVQISRLWVCGVGKQDVSSCAVTVYSLQLTSPINVSRLKLSTVILFSSTIDVRFCSNKKIKLSPSFPKVYVLILLLNKVLHLLPYF